eukprot:CAMPEP_0185521336 /NCGR_PEP_ID=MMETSP1366-20130426/79750_1 /TAXON_ID=38817 /ORGANISM="Gephyrocapsa oceanica, Strain RCC1303" /LENGTH=59 /DNA_ID=CAMNT_0028132483 /DNA_START=36 /DNA_END=211 /DNA_ORIENTATION=-
MATPLWGLCVWHDRGWHERRRRAHPVRAHPVRDEGRCGTGAWRRRTASPHRRAAQAPHL